jgi:hypothetical protein
MSTGALWFLIFAVLMMLSLAVERLCAWHRIRRRRNRYRRGFLPPPQSNCIAGQGWKATAQQGTRY